VREPGKWSPLRRRDPGWMLSDSLWAANDSRRLLATLRGS